MSLADITRQTQEETSKRVRTTCDWCGYDIQCDTCPDGAYHSHRHCYPIAKSQGYFAKLGPANQEIPVECGVDTYHFVKGYLPV